MICHKKEEKVWSFCYPSETTNTQWTVWHSGLFSMDCFSCQVFTSHAPCLVRIPLNGIGHTVVWSAQVMWQEIPQTVSSYSWLGQILNLGKGSIKWSWQVSFEVQWSDIERVVWCLCWGWSFGIVGAVGASGRMHSLCLPAIAQFGENSEAGGGLARQKDTCSLIKRSNGCQQCWGEANNTHAKY